VSPLLFANLSKLTLSETQEGGAIDWPKLVPGFDLCATLRLTKTLEGAVELSRRTLVSLKATIGEVDARPTAGTVMMKVGGDAESAGVNTTAAIAFSATAADVATAFNALSGPTALKPFTCVERNGSWILRAAAGAQMTLTVVDNDLWPSSRVDIREFTFDEAYSYELRLCQVPVAEVTTFNSVVPPVPTVSQVRAGADNSGVLTSEIQKVYVPPENPEGFAFALKKGFKRSDPITNLVVEDVQAAVAKLYDLTAGEELRIFEGDNGFLVEFLGDAWLGLNQDLLEVEVVNEARADIAFRLITATNEMATRMRNVPTNGEVKLPLEITLGLENEQNALLTDYSIFRSELTFVRPVSMARFSAAAAINWNTPLTRESYQQFSPSQVATGQRHYLISTAIGNGSTTVFNIDHNLGTRYLLCQLQESAADGEFLILGTDYDIEIVTDNRIKITFASAPATSSVIGQITSAAHSANFQPHTHDIDDITDLESRLAALEENVSELQDNAAAGSGGSRDTAMGSTLVEVNLGMFAEAYPMRTALMKADEMADIKRLAEISPTVYPRDGGLIGAVHDAVLEALPGTLPTPGAGNKGKVYYLTGSTNVTLPGSGGRKSTVLKPGEYAASNGNHLYKVARQTPGGTAKVFTAATTDVITSAAHGWENGQAVMMSTAGVLPAGLAIETRYFVIDKTTDTFKVSLTSGGSAVDITDIGTGVHSVFTAPPSSFYPVDFEREFAVVAINSDMLTVGRTAEYRIGLEVAILNAKTPAPRISDKQTRAQWELRIEWGVRTSESSPTTTDVNLKGITWDATPILSKRLDLTSSPTIHTLGARIKRTGASTWVTSKQLYGLWQSSAATINVADFHLRARLTRFDVEDIDDARGFVLLLGTQVSAEESTAVGTLQIK
jgi:hypothetical protein